MSTMVNTRMASKKLCMGYGCDIKGLHTLDLIRNRTLAPGKWSEHQNITPWPNANLRIYYAPICKSPTLNARTSETQYPGLVPSWACELVK